MNVTINGDVYVSGCCSECTPVQWTIGTPSAAGTYVVRGFVEVNAGRTVTLRIDGADHVVDATGPVQWTVAIGADRTLEVTGCGRYWHTGIEPSVGDPL